MIVNGDWRFPCPCCGYYTLEGEAGGTYEICPVCFWEDDPVQLRDANYRGGANEESLNEAREKFRNGTAQVGEFVRQPRPEEYPPGDEHLWEYRTFRIPLRRPKLEQVAVGSDAWGRMFAAADHIIAPEVDRLLAEGWERTHPADYQYLANHHRIYGVVHSNGSRGEPVVATYQGVRVRLRRRRRDGGQMA